MSDQSSLPLQALPDGQAEVRLVLHLRWEDVAALGQEAGRLAARLQRSVSLDEAASYRLGARSAYAASDRAKPAAASSGSSSEQARQALEKINGSGHAGAGGGAAPEQSSAAAAEARGALERPSRHPSSVAGISAAPGGSAVAGPAPQTTRATG